MRMTEFWARMEGHFGARYAGSVAHDQVLRQLDGQTVDQALEGGANPKTVWRAVCDAFDVPAAER